MFLISLLIIFLNLYIFHPWLAINQTLSSGDWPYLFSENIKQFSFIPSAGVLWLTPYYEITSKFLVQYLGLNWNLAEKILWFWPFILISMFSSYYLTKSWLGVLIYSTNTYVLMLVGGGQMGVAMSYSFAPLILASFIKIIQASKTKVKNLFIAGLVLALQITFDPRVAYITLIAVFFFLLFKIEYKKSKENVKNILRLLFFSILIPIGVAILLNMYWIIPLLRGGLSSAFSGYSSLSGFEFFSFADFSHALSLLHPNWPENIFGKVYFMQPEFILLPVIAYSSLIFVKKIRQGPLFIYFAFLGVLGSFLAKGANIPFGEINNFLFQHFPGMSMFRDSSKFYILIALAYSILIPFVLKALSEKKIGKYSLKYYPLIIFLIFWFFTIRPALASQLNGTFKPNDIPSEYIILKNFLENQPETFKTLWIPNVQRFGFRSNIHPALEGTEYFSTSSAGISSDLTSESIKSLGKSSIKYVIVPYDSEKELFIIDRKYNENERTNLLQKLRKIHYLRELPPIGRISIFEVLPQK